MEKNEFNASNYSVRHITTGKCFDMVPKALMGLTKMIWQQVTIWIVCFGKSLLLNCVVINVLDMFLSSGLLVSFQKSVSLPLTHADCVIYLN